MLRFLHRRIFYDKLKKRFFYKNTRGKRIYLNNKYDKPKISIQKRHFANLQKSSVNLRLPILEQQNILYQQLSNQIREKAANVYLKRNQDLDYQAKQLQAKLEQEKDQNVKNQLAQQISMIQEKQNKNLEKADIQRKNEGLLKREDFDAISWFSKKTQSSLNQQPQKKNLMPIIPEDKHEKKLAFTGLLSTQKKSLKQNKNLTKKQIQQEMEDFSQQEDPYEILRYSKFLKENEYLRKQYKEEKKLLNPEQSYSFSQSKEYKDKATQLRKKYMMKYYNWALEEIKNKDILQEIDQIRDPDEIGGMEGKNCIGFSAKKLKSAMQTIFEKLGFKVVFDHEYKKIKPHQQAIVLFTQNNHLSVCAIFEGLLEYFEPQADQGRREEDFQKIQLIAQYWSPEHTLKFKWNNNVVQKQPGLCGYYCLVFLFRRFYEQMSYKNSTSHMKRNQKAVFPEI